MVHLHRACAAMALGAGVLALGAGPAAASTDETRSCDLHATVQPRQDTTPRRLDVTLRFAAEGRSISVLRLTPGWGGVNDFAAAFSGWAAAPDSARVTPLAEPHRWQVQHPAQGQVTVAYQVQAALPDPDDGRPQPQEQLYRVQLGPDWFQFFGHAVLPSVEAWGDDRRGRMCLTLHPAAGSAGPLLGSHFDGRAAAAQTVQLEGTHALLRHAVYAGGPGWRVQQRALASGPVLVAVRGRHGFDDTLLADAVARLVDVQRCFWGDTAVPPQQVLVTPNFSPGNNGGTRVHQASVLHVGARFQPGDPGFEFLIGHENLHDWLPGRLGGHGGGDAVSAARHYWLSEGFTDYYTHRLLLASGLWGLPQYAAKLTQVLQTYWRSSERSAGIDSLAPRFFSHRDAGRQLYARGEMLAMHWDRALRERGHPGLDALLRGLLLPPAPPGGLTGAGSGAAAHERVMAALTAQLGPGPQQDLQRLVGQGRDLPLEAGLAGPCFTLGWQAVPRWVLGFDPRSFQQKQAVGVLPEGPAWRAGLREGMPLAGWSVHGNDVQQDVVLWARPVGEPEARAQELRYRPVDGSTDRLPQLQVREGAAGDAACTAWQRRERDVPPPPGAPTPAR